MKKIISFLILVGVALVFMPHASAQLLGGDALKQMSDTAGTVRHFAGFSSNASVGGIIAAIIRAILSLLAAIFLVLMILSGFKWMTAAGNEEQVKKAQETIKSALIGLVIVLAAYAITYYVFTYLPFSGGAANVRLDGRTGVSS
jgi:hypothetical protein